MKMINGGVCAAQGFSAAGIHVGVKAHNLEKKDLAMILSAVIGYLLGLNGFQFVLEFIYPPQGYIGIVFLTLVVINFLKQLRGKTSLRKC